MVLSKTIDQLRICSDMLADVDSWDSFFPAITATKAVLKSFVSNLFKDRISTLPPVKIFDLMNQLEMLERCEITVANFCTQTLDRAIVDMEFALHDCLSSKAFYEALALVLKALSIREAANESDLTDSFLRIQAHRDVDKAVSALWIAFSGLQKSKQENLLNTSPTTITLD